MQTIELPYYTGFPQDLIKGGITINVNEIVYHYIEKRQTVVSEERCTVAWYCSLSKYSLQNELVCTNQGKINNSSV